MTTRIMTASPWFVLLAALVGGCGADAANELPKGGGAGGGANVSTTGTSGGTSNGGSGGLGGSSEVGAMGGSSVAGGSPFPSADGVDNGSLFAPDSAVSYSPAPAVTGDAGPQKSEAGAPGDGNMATCKLGGGYGKAEFTQHGLDVTVVVTLTNCAPGDHMIRIHEGFSCDNTNTEGAVWDGKRGDGIGSAGSVITCNANRTGTLTYTRSGGDAATRWTVGDHSIATDVTNHVMIVGDVANPSARLACGNFFG